MTHLLAVVVVSLWNTSPVLSVQEVIRTLCSPDLAKVFDRAAGVTSGVVFGDVKQPASHPIQLRQ